MEGVVVVVVAAAAVATGEITDGEAPAAIPTMTGPGAAVAVETVVLGIRDVEMMKSDTRDAGGFC